MGSRKARIRLEDIVGTSKHSDISELIRLAQSGAKYLVIGEYHYDNCIKDLLEKLIERGHFSSLFLEALAEGDYAKDGPLLKDLDCVYSQNPKKYDRLIKSAINRGVNVYGLESGGARKEKNGKVYKEWAGYVKENGRGSCIVLIGADHVDYWKGHPNDSKNFVSKLVDCGVSPKNIVTVSSFPIKIVSGSGVEPELLYFVRRLPKNVTVPKIDSYLRINPNGFEDKNDRHAIDSHSVPTFGENGRKKRIKSLLMPKFRYQTRTVYIPAFVNGKGIADYIYAIDKRHLERAMKRPGKVDID